MQASKLFFSSSFLTRSNRYDLNLLKLISSSLNLFFVINFGEDFISGVIFLLNFILI